jgi:hypothetical protein
MHHKLIEIACEWCGTAAMKRRGARFCSKRCAVLRQHAAGLARQASGSDNGHWKGSAASYQSVHQRIARQRGVASRCENRSALGCISEKYEWAHIHGTDPHDVDNYRQLCKSCHITYDHQRGAENANAKLSISDVASIRERYAASGVSQQSLADEYGVAQPITSKVVRYESYV